MGTGLRVQAEGGFVEEQQAPRLVQEGARSPAGAHSAGELLDVVAAAVLQADEAEQQVRPFTQQFLGDTVEHVVQLHVFVGGELVVGGWGSWKTRMHEGATDRGGLAGRDRGRRTLVQPRGSERGVVARILIVETVPAPFGPRKARIVPVGTLNEMRSTAVNAPNCFTRSCTSIIAVIVRAFACRGRFSWKWRCVQCMGWGVIQNRNAWPRGRRLIQHGSAEASGQRRRGLRDLREGKYSDCASREA